MNPDDDVVRDDGAPGSGAGLDGAVDGAAGPGVDGAPGLDGAGDGDPGLDGHTMAELGEYLDRGRTPVDPSIEASAACRLALVNLTRLSELSARALVARAAREPEREEAWIAGLLDTIRAEVRSGRDIPVSHPDPRLRLTMTEAAVRGIVRRAGDTLGGVVMGRCSLIGDIGTPGASVRVEATCAVRFGLPVAETAERLRERILEALAVHTELTVERVDVTVDDVYTGEEEGR